MKPLFKEPRARRKSDFYPTRDPYAVPALCPLIGWGAPENGWWPGDVWEPACGEGDMSRALEAKGFKVTSTDLEDHDYGLDGMDFLLFDKPLARSIITNPPFSLAEKFIRHAKAIGVEYVALLLKTDWFCAATRVALWEQHPPTAVGFMAWRIDFTGDGAAPMTTSWFVWTPDDGKQPTAVSVLKRPDRR